MLAQRLARKICTECKVQVPTDENTLLNLGFGEEELSDIQVFRGAGCPNCNNNGYRGRIALYEVMPFSEKLKEMVLQGCSTAELKERMIQDGVATLRRAGLNKIVDGTTTIDEVVRVTAADR